MKKEDVIVNSVSSSDPRLRLQKAGLDTNVGKAKDASGPAGTAAPGAVDGVELSKTAQAMPSSGIDVGPPFDLELVTRIKKEIAEGRYPIDLEAITDSLFDSYRDLVS